MGPWSYYVGVRYTHGHHDSVLRGHRWRTAANSAAYLLEHLGPGLDLVDLGCGPGTITLDLAALVAPGQVVGVDRAEAVIELARGEAERRGVGPERIRFVAAPAESTGLAAASADVVHAHQLLQHVADPVAVMLEMARICRPAGILAARDADYGAMSWFPEDPRLDHWRACYREVARRNGGEPDAGRRLLSWARAAGWSDVRASASVWCFATDEDRAWWGGQWAERVRSSDLARGMLDHGVASAADLATMAQAFRDWADSPDGWFLVVHGELLATPGR